MIWPPQIPCTLITCTSKNSDPYPDVLSVHYPCLASSQWFVVRDLPYSWGYCSQRACSKNPLFRIILPIYHALGHPPWILQHRQQSVRTAFNLPSEGPRQRDGIKSATTKAPQSLLTIIFLYHQCLLSSSTQTTSVITTPFLSSTRSHKSSIRTVRSALSLQIVGLGFRGSMYKVAREEAPNRIFQYNYLIR